MSTASPRFRRRPAPALALIVLAPAMLAVGGAAAQERTIDEVVTEQNRVIEKYRDPLEMQERIGINVEEDLATAPETEDVSFRLRRVELTGADSIAREALAPNWRPYLDTVIRAAELASVTQAIETFYRESDIYARAIVREIDFQAGVVRIAVFEGYIREIVVDSEVPGLKQRLQPYLDRIAALVPLRVSRLERELLLIADLEGYSVNAQLEQIPDQLGVGRLTLTITPGRRSGQVLLDNLASRETGPLELTGVATAGDVLGLFERTSLVGITNPAATNEFAYLDLSQSFPVGTHGWRAGYAIGRIWSRPGGDLAGQNLEVDTTLASFSLEYPVIRRIAYNLITRAEVHAQDNQVEAGPMLAVEDRARWLTLSATYDETFNNGTLLARGAVSQGIDALGATPGDRREAGRPGGEADFLRLGAKLRGSYRLASALSVNANVIGQLGLTPLPDAARLNIGGDPFGRAFVDASVAGDSGVAGSIELERTLDLERDWLARSSAFAFADYGYVHNDDVGVEFDSARLGSAGVGLRVLLMRDVHAEGFAAVPTTASGAVDEDEGARLHFTLGVRL